MNQQGGVSGESRLWRWRSLSEQGEAGQESSRDRGDRGRGRERERARARFVRPRPRLVMSFPFSRNAAGPASAGSLRGTSTLRKEDPDKAEAKSQKAKDLEAYLSTRYADASDDAKGAQGKKRRKKKRKKGAQSGHSAGGGNLVIIDASAGGIPTALGQDASSDEGPDGGDDDAPVVVNADEMESERMLKAKQNVIRSNQRWQTVSVPTAKAKPIAPPTTSRPTRHDSSEDEGDEVGGRRRQRYDFSDDDDSDSDMEVDRRRGRAAASDSSDQSNDSDSDLDVRRRGRKDDDTDSGEDDEDGGPRAESAGGTGGAKDDRTMADGTATGLVSSAKLKEELDRKRREKAAYFERMDPNLSGKAAQTVYRDRATGEKLTAEELKQKEEEQQEKHQKPLWTGGLAQQRQQMEQRMALSNPDRYGVISATRHESGLRDRIRFGDPMAHLVSSKTTSAHGGEDFDEENGGAYVAKYGISLKDLRSQGYIIPAGVPQHSWMKRKVRCPENRFGIKPGRFWDGVDRSNGFERDYFRETNKRRTRNEQAFMWSQEDM